MSKKSSDIRITKSSNDEDDPRDDSSTADTLQSGSADEHTRRPLRSMRRLVSRAATSESATRSPKSPRSPRSPRSPILRASTRPTSTGAKTSTSASTPTSTKPPAVFSGFIFGASTSNNSTDSVKKLAFSKDAFSFNIGSSGKSTSTNTTFTIGASSSGDSARSPSSVDTEAYERALSGINFSFVKKIQKEIKYNPAVDLTTFINQYLTQRKKVRHDFEGLDEPGAAVVVANTSSSIIGNNGGGNISGVDGLDGAQSGTTITTLSKPESESTPEQNQPQETREFERSNSAGNLPNGLLTPTGGGAALSSHFSPSYGGSFTSSSVKGAVDPPRNPTSYWSNTRGGGSQGPTTSPFGRALRERNPSPAASPTASFSTSFRRPFASPFTGKPTSSTPASALSLAAAAQSGAASKFPKPFAFDSPKPKEPFVFDRTKFSVAGAGPTETAATLASDRKRGRSPEDGDDQPSKCRITSIVSAEAEVESRGQEEEVKVFEVRAKLFKMVQGVYINLGVGQFLVNENPSTKKRRMFMRSAMTGLVIMNSLVIPQLPAKHDLDTNTVKISTIENKEPRQYTSTAPPSIKVFSIPELLSEITQHLDYLDVMNCLQVNKDWHQAWHSHWMTLFNHLLLDFDKRRSFFQTVPTMESYVKNSAHYPHACGPRHPTLSALLDHAQGQNGQAKEMVIVWNPKELPKGYNVTSASDLPETNTEGNIHVFLRNNSRTTLPKAIQFLGQVKCLALRLGILWDNGSALEDICTLLRSIPMTTEKLCLQPNQYRGWGQRSAPRAVELTTLAYQTLLARGSNETTAPSPDSALSTIATADGVAGPGEIADIEVNHQLQALSGLSLDPTPTTLPVGPSLFPALTTLDISNCLTLSSQTAAITELLPNCPLLYDITFPSLGNGISAVAALALQQRHPPIGKILMGEPERPQASAGAINLLNACGATLRKLKMTLKAKPYQEKSLVASIIRHWQLVDLTLVEWGHSNESLVQILSLLPNLRHFSLETVVKNLAWGRRQRQLLPASHKSRFLDIYAVPLFEDKPLFASERLESLNLSLGCSWDETLADDYDHLKYVRNA
ncbi:hypothetical protein BGW38_003315, partial [Lunasporangiospora selenospora]